MKVTFRKEIPEQRVAATEEQMVVDLKVPTYFLGKCPFSIPVNMVSDEIANIKPSKDEIVELVNMDLMMFNGTHMIWYGKKYLGSRRSGIRAIVMNSAIYEPDGFNADWLDNITTEEKFMEALAEYKDAKDRLSLTITKCM